MNTLTLVLVCTLANVSLGHWWVTAGFVQQYGVGFMVLVALGQLLMLTALFHIERMLARVFPTRVMASERYPHYITSGYARAFTIIISMGFIASLLLAAHNLLVFSWQSHIVWKVLGESWQLSDYTLLVSDQSALMGTYPVQLGWLVVVIVCVLTLQQWLLGRYTHSAQAMLVVGWLLAVTVFTMLFFWQNDLDLAAIVASATTYNPEMITQALLLAVESSLSAFGIFFALRYVFQHDLKKRFLAVSMMLLVVISALFTLVSVIVLTHSGIDSSGFLANKQLVLAPLYMHSLFLSDVMLIVWMLVIGILAVLKILVLAGVCLYVITFNWFPALSRPNIFTAICLGLTTIAIFFLAIGSNTQVFDERSTPFQSVFIDGLYFWYPWQIAAIIALVASLPNEAWWYLHGRGSLWVDYPIRPLSWLLVCAAVGLGIMRIITA